MQKTHTVYLLLGSNKGHRLKFLLLAQYLIQQNAGEIITKSTIYKTAAWGKEHQPDYLNQVICIKSKKTPLQLLRLLQKTEKKMGRTIKHNYAARTIDIDILFYDNLVFDAKNLTIPHPKLHLRKFTLMPLYEIDKSYTHPILQKSIDELLKICTDNLKVSIFDNKRNLI